MAVSEKPEESRKINVLNFIIMKNLILTVCAFFVLSHTHGQVNSADLFGTILKVHNVLNLNQANITYASTGVTNDVCNVSIDYDFTLGNNVDVFTPNTYFQFSYPTSGPITYTREMCVQEVGSTNNCNSNSTFQVVNYHLGSSQFGTSNVITKSYVVELKVFQGTNPSAIYYKKYYVNFNFQRAPKPCFNNLNLFFECEKNAQNLNTGNIRLRLTGNIPSGIPASKLRIRLEGPVTANFPVTATANNLDYQITTNGQYTARLQYNTSGATWVNLNDASYCISELVFSKGGRTCMLQLQPIRLDFVGRSNFEDGMSEIAVYPNPSSSVFNVKLPDAVSEVSYRVMDISGKVLIQATSKTSDEFRVDLSAFTNGVYFLKINTEVKESTIKLVKQ